MDHHPIIWTMKLGTLDPSFGPSAQSYHGPSWAKRSREVLDSLGLLDWPAWSVAGDSYDEYCTYIHDALAVRYASRWQIAAARHRVPIDLTRVASSTSDVLKLAMKLDLGWAVLIGQRAVARLRCGLIPLGHKDGRSSSAATQSCVFCNCCSSSMWAHVFAVCPRWLVQRQVILESNFCHSVRPWDLMYFIVGATPDSPAYGACVSFVAQVVAGAERFWRDSSGDAHAEH